MSPQRSLARLVALAALAQSALANPLIIGHRGTGVSSGNNPWPENSLPSLRRAFEEGADLVEIDVQLAKDGTPILWHDKYVTVEGKEYRPDQLDPGQYPLLHGSDGQVAEVPTFRAALRAALELAPGPIALDIEIKISWDDQRNPLIAAVSQVIREERAGRRVMLSSFDADSLKLLENELPGVVTGLLGVWKGATLSAAKKLAAQGYPIEWVIPSHWAPFAAGGVPEGAASQVDLAMASFIRKAHDAGFRVGVWTVNDADGIAGRVEDGYDAVITDEPDVGRQVVPPYGLQPFSD